MIDSTTNFVEHPRLVAQRIGRYADIVGRERVIAGVDCGFGTFGAAATRWWRTASSGRSSPALAEARRSPASGCGGDGSEEHSVEVAKVFISYSRTDGSALADELVAGLELAGFEPYLDTEDIEKAVDVEDRLGALILKADTVVFIISPGSVSSPHCQWEVDRTVELHKRIIPVQWIKVDEAEVPEQLRRLNYIIFRGGQSFARPLAELVKALRAGCRLDSAHIRDLASRPPIGRHAAKERMQTICSCGAVSSLTLGLGSHAET